MIRCSAVVLTLVMIAVWGLEPSARAADEPVLVNGALTYPEGADIPRSLTEIERSFLNDNPLTDLLGETPPPTGPVSCPGQYEPMDGILIAWEGQTPILSAMAAFITTTGDADLYVMVDSTAERTTAQSTLQAAGTDMDRVFFQVVITDTIWIRDYGPRYIYQGQCRAIIDHTYNRPRPNDDVQPFAFAALKNHELYEIPLIHGGGNYHISSLGESNTTRLINQENPGLTEQEIHDLWEDYQNVDTTFYTRFPTGIDSTGHIDMWMQVIDDQAVVISDWPNNVGSTQDQICDGAATLLAGRGYTVHRVPARSVSGVHYTYTQVVMCNNLVMIPLYTNATVAPHNPEALAAWQAAVPGKTVVQINSQAIIPLAGALHCIAMHLPAHLGGENPTAYLVAPNGPQSFNPGQITQVKWISDDDVAVQNADLLLSVDAGATFPFQIAGATADDGLHNWTIPNLANDRVRVRVRARDAGLRTGFDDSDADLTINGVFGDYTGNGVANLNDYANWPDCATGPDGGPYTVPCGIFDADADTDIDLADFADLAIDLATETPAGVVISPFQSIRTLELQQEPAEAVRAWP